MWWKEWWNDCGGNSLMEGVWWKGKEWGGKSGVEGQD